MSLVEDGFTTLTVRLTDRLNDRPTDVSSATFQQIRTGVHASRRVVGLGWRQVRIEKSNRIQITFARFRPEGECKLRFKCFLPLLVLLLLVVLLLPGMSDPTGFCFAALLLKRV